MAYDTSAMIKYREAYGDPPPSFSQLTPQRVPETNEAALLQRIADLESAMKQTATVTTGELAELRDAIGELREDPYISLTSGVTPHTQPPAYYPNRSSTHA